MASLWPSLVQTNAFSQTDESQARVLNAYDTTRERGRYGELAGTEEQGPPSQSGPPVPQDFL